ncbi:MAG: RNA polymerase sigma factor [Bacteroidota bacterium]
MHNPHQTLSSVTPQTFASYRQLHLRLTQLCFAKYGDFIIAEDGASLAFQKLLEHPQPHTIKNIHAWLTKVAQNACLRYITRYRQREAPHSALPEPDPVMPHFQLSEEVEKRIKRFLQSRLSAQDMGIFTLFMEGYSNAEIGQSLGIGSKTVANRKSIIRKTLRKARFIQHLYKELG